MSDLVVPPEIPPRVTVAIPAFNAAGTIADAIHSLHAQTLHDIETIVIDDASTDDTVRVARQCASNARIISMTRNTGLSAALNRALELASAPYLLQLDADDWLEPAALERAVEALDSSPSVVAVYANPIIHDPDGTVSRVRSHAITSPAAIITHRPQQVPRAYRVAALRAAGGWPTDDAAGGRFYEDRRMLLRISEFGVVRHLDEWLYNVRRREGSLSVDPESRVAKFAILTSEANRLGMSLRVLRRGPPLCAEFVTRRSSPPRQPWSVIISSGCQSEFLGLTLRSWLESDWASSGSEIVIVGNLSRPSIPIPAEYEHRIRTIQSESLGDLASARNLGAHEARHATLLFADSDHIVPPDVLGIHQWYQDQAAAPALVMGGAFARQVFSRFLGSEIGSKRINRLLAVIRHHPRYAEVAAGIRRDDYVTIADEQTLDLWWTLLPFTFVDEAELELANLLLRHGHDLTTVLPQSRVRAVNLSVSATLFADLGGFDEDLPSSDWTLGLRAHRRGVRILVALEAETFRQAHPEHPQEPEFAA